MLQIIILMLYVSGMTLATYAYHFLGHPQHWGKREEGIREVRDAKLCDGFRMPSLGCQILFTTYTFILLFTNYC